MKPGTKVRFTADSLGAFDLELGSHRFVEQKFDRGQTGTVSDWEPGPAMGDWFGVIPDDAPELLVPVNEAMVEEIHPE